jgi:uncharacterized OsmC-like protein
MPAKSIQVEIRQAQGFKTDCQVGKHMVVIDQPAATGGTDTGPTPLDYQLIALGSGITAFSPLASSRLPALLLEFALGL